MVCTFLFGYNTVVKLRQCLLRIPAITWAMAMTMIRIMTILIWCSTPLSTLFQSYRDDGKMIMKGSVQ